MTTGERLFLFMIVAVVGGLLLSGFAVYSYSWEVMRFPVIAGTATIPLCILALLALGSRKSARPVDEDPSGLSSEAVLRFVGRVAVVIPLVFLFGYAIGLSLYLLYHLRRNGESWGLAAALSLACFAFTYFVFSVALGRPFEAGFLASVL